MRGHFYGYRLCAITSELVLILLRVQVLSIILAKKSSNTMRYIGDLLTLNNPAFHNAIGDISSRASAQKDNRMSHNTIILRHTYYNRQWEILNCGFRQKGQFHVQHRELPPFKLYILSKPAYGVYISQLVCIGRICSSLEHFKHRHYTLTQKLIKQGFWYSGLCMAFQRFAKYHAAILWM